MIFSDNVPVAAEQELKRLAVARDLLVMRPDCGTPR
jgi:succinyl-CoA synthetase alpha subunit